MNLLIDFHTHAFPDALARKAIPKLAGIGGIRSFGDGTVSDLIAHMDEWGVDRSVLLNIATNPHQQPKVNDFAIACNSHPGLYALGSLNPESDCIAAEARRLADAGIKGIKLHPDYMGFTVDDPSFDPIYEAAVDNGLFVAVHSGWDFISPELIHCTPERIVKVLDRHPDLRLIAAHMGANRLWEDVERLLVGRKNLWLDTSLASAFGLDPALAKRILENHDPKQLLFGSDFPWFTPDDTYKYIESLGLSDSLKRGIYYENALSLLE